MRVFSSPSCFAHNPGTGHPDQSTRLAAVREALGPHHQIVDAEPAPIEVLARCHDAEYLGRAAALSRAGGGELGPDTSMSAGSWDAARAASGAVLAALDTALAEGQHAFAAIRPPGHHAVRDRAMGFCLVNHVAVAPHEALRRGRERVLIVDWDVHHGNGTQALVEHDRRHPVRLDAPVALVSGHWFAPGARRGKLLQHSVACRLARPMRISNRSGDGIVPATTRLGARSDTHIRRL